MSWPPRYTILLLLFLLSLVNYIDRVNISITAPVMMPELGWDTELFGVVFSAFICGYALFMIPSGLLADTWSPKFLLALACCGWSLFTLLTPLGRFSFLLRGRPHPLSREAGIASSCLSSIWTLAQVAPGIPGRSP